MSLDKKLLTAFALGEARGADQERAKAMVERDPEARKFVDEIRAFSKTAAADFAKEPLPEDRGVGPIRAEIDKRAKARAAAPSARGWWREVSVAALVLVAVVAVGHKKILRVAQDRLGNKNEVPLDYEAESFFGSEGLRVERRKFSKLEPEKFGETFQTLALIDSRTMEEVVLGRCRFHLPEVSSKETSSETGPQLMREYQGEGGMLVQVMAAEFSRASFQLTQGEEVSKSDETTLMKQVTDEGPGTFYQIPKKADEPVCGLKVLMPQMDFTQADTGEVRAAVNNFGKKLAGMVVIK